MAHIIAFLIPDGYTFLLFTSLLRKLLSSSVNRILKLEIGREEEHLQPEFHLLINGWPPNKEMYLNTIFSSTVIALETVLSRKYLVKE